MEKLRKQLEEWLNLLDDSEDIQDSLKTIESNYPFNKFEFVISHLLATKKLNLDEYKEIREDYLNRNKYLRVFEISAQEDLAKVGRKKNCKNLCQISKSQVKSWMQIIRDNTILFCRQISKLKSRLRVQLNLKVMHRFISRHFQLIQTNALI